MQPYILCCLQYIIMNTSTTELYHMEHTTSLFIEYFAYLQNSAGDRRTDWVKLSKIGSL